MASKKVSKIHGEAPEVAKPPDRVVRWLIPAGASFPTYQHAAFVAPTRASFTVCKGHHVEGAIYPPSKAIPKCAECVEGIERLEQGGADVNG